VISSPQRPLPDNTQHPQQTNIHDPGGIRTHDLSRRAAADLRLRPCGHLDRSMHRNTVLIYIQQDATLHSLFYLEAALHVSGGSITHHQERKQLYLQHLVFVTPLLLYAAIVEELELVCVCVVGGVRHPQHTSQSTQFSFNSFGTPAGSNLNASQST